MKKNNSSKRHAGRWFGGTSMNTIKKRKSMKMKLFCLAACAMAMTATDLTAQTFTTLHSFPALHNDENSDGAYPNASLILSGNTLYGTARTGGLHGTGTVFKVNTDGTGFTTLHVFTARSGSSEANSDGAYPQEEALLLSGTWLYGTAESGGSYGKGTVFAVSTDGTGFTTLHNFTATSGTKSTNNDGAYPQDALILSGNTLYGTAIAGGSSGNGTVFAVNTEGSGFTNLHSFTASSGPVGPHSLDGTNSDGDAPWAGLILSGNTLYGTANGGGPYGSGTVFAVNTDGTRFTNLHSFTATLGSEGGYGTNSDGTYPQDVLILSGNTLYGTANTGGPYGSGTVFAVNTNGTGFTTLHGFTATDAVYPGNDPPYPNYPPYSDGAYPWDGLILSGNTLYGTANAGGSSGWGTVFALNTDGTGFTNLHSFTATRGTEGGFGTNRDGILPVGGLILSGNTLYGTAAGGGTSGYGTVFSITLPAPQLTITASDTNVIMTWPTNYAGFDYTGYTLQSTTNLVSPAVWSPVVPGPVVVNGQFTVTNPLSGAQQFYQLSQ